MGDSAEDVGRPVGMRIKDASRLVDVDPETVRRLCRAGKVTAFKVGRSWRVDRESLLESLGVHVARVS